MKSNYTAAGLLSFAVVDGLMCWAMWAGWVQGVEGAKNVASLVIWTLFAISWFCWSDRAIADAKKKPRRVPRWLSRSVSIAWVLFLAWHGSWALAVALLMTMINMLRIDEVTKRNEEQAA